MFGFSNKKEKFPGIDWYCDDCGDYLNSQSGFHDGCGDWTCTKCGQINPINEDEIIWDNGFVGNEDDYIRSLKKEDVYNFSYSYEYIVKRYGDGDDDFELAIATVDIRVSWDDTSVPGYTLSYQISAPTSLPNDYTTTEEGIFQEVCGRDLVWDLIDIGISPKTFKDWNY